MPGYLHAGLRLPEVPGGVREEGGVGVVRGHGVERGRGRPVLPAPVVRGGGGGAVRGVPSLGRGEARHAHRGRQRVVVVGGGHGVGLRVVAVLPAIWNSVDKKKVPNNNKVINFKIFSSHSVSYHLWADPFKVY